VPDVADILGAAALTFCHWANRRIDVNNSQAVGLGQLTSLGKDPTRYRTVAVKSMQHFRAAFEPIARAVVLVDTAPCARRSTPPSFSPRSAARFGRSTDP
jgi:microcystin degradation protein MlrC